MADRRKRDLIRLLHAVAEPCGAGVAIETSGSGHWRCTFTIADRHAYIITSRTPRCPFAHQNVKADARRTLRHLAEAGVMP
jgi:hypothetical protein